MDIEKKIRKLLALSESPNEFEAQAALLKARQLMAEYKLTEAELHEGNKKVKTIKTSISCTKQTNFWIFRWKMFWRTETVTACTTCQHNLMRFWRIEICHITDIYEKQKDYSVLKNEEKYMIEKVYDDNTLSFKEKGLYTAIYLNETMNVDQLVESGKDKADAVRSGLKKLIEKQYIKKSVVREKNGNFVTVYYQVIE